jgi:hypothetical protein
MAVSVRQIAQTGTVPPSIAQQVFVIGSGIAGGLAGIVLAKQFAGRIEEVPVAIVVGTTLISAIFTIGAGWWLAKRV